MHESLLAIFLHFVACLGHIATITIFVPVVYFNNTVCNNAVQCKTFHEWMELIGAPIVTSKVYVYAVVSMAFHIIMTPISLRMVKYAAAVDAVERYTKAESKKRMAREAASAKLAIVETTLA
uniref:Uncharacterized protein n=1 Tax=Caenorhabditis japonica TaxID=281687 RepID=A0A8R1IGS8_CAEJA